MLAEVRSFLIGCVQMCNCACVPHLYVNVVVVSLCELDEDSEERQNGLCAEEGAFRPDHGCREQA